MYKIRLFLKTWLRGLVVDLASKASHYSCEAGNLIMRPNPPGLQSENKARLYLQIAKIYIDFAKIISAVEAIIL